MAEHHGLGGDFSALDLEAKLIHQLVGQLRAEVSQDGRKAAECVAKLLEQGGALVFPALRAWSEDPNPQVRKGLIKAVANTVDPGDPFRAAFLFDLLSPLLWDADPGVRALARRVLRKKLIPTYPEEALQALACWAAEWESRKQIFAAHCLARLPSALARRALIPLRHLVRAADARVRQAALHALKLWRARNPHAVEAELKRWKDIPELVKFIGRVDV